MSPDTGRGNDDTSLVPLSVDVTPRTGSEAFTPPMIPGAREPGMLTTFGVHPIVFSGGPIAMDAVTTAARQREGGGAPNQRRPAREGSLLTDLWRRLQRSLGATPQADAGGQRSVRIAPVTVTRLGDDAAQRTGIGS